jgi:3-hydroxyisobutyrate dehydrogenase
MKIAFLGTGLMGRPMAERLIAAGHEVFAWNRTRDKAEPLASRGARVAGTPAEAIQAAPCVVVMLADEPAIRSVLAGNVELEGRTILQMSTISPGQSRSLCEDLERRGAAFLEAPVLGSVPAAEAGRLIVMVGSSQARFETWLPLFRVFGAEPRHVGEVGNATALKLALNQLIGSLTAAFAASLAFVERSGVDVDLFVEILRGSALHAPTFDSKLPHMRAHDYTRPSFPTRHLGKDVGLFLEEAQRLGLDTAAVEGVSTIVRRAVESGLGDLDYSSILEIIAGRAGKR